MSAVPLELPGVAATGVTGPAGFSLPGDTAATGLTGVVNTKQNKKRHFHDIRHCTLTRLKSFKFM